MEHALSLEAGNEVDAAIARVLDAERAATQDVVAAGGEASRIAEAARASVRELEARTERRIRTLRAAFAAATQAELDRLAGATAQAAEPVRLSRDDDHRVATAVARLAAELTGGDA